VLAEVNFDTDEELEGFQKPQFALADVTNSELFGGGALSQLTFLDLREEIVKLVHSGSSSVLT